MLLGAEIFIMKKKKKPPKTNKPILKKKIYLRGENMDPRLIKRVSL